MRALQMTAPAPDSGATDVVEVAERAPGPAEVAIDVAFAGVNFIDVMARRGDPGYASGWPYVGGLEVAGRVRAVGAGVDPGRVGQRVAAFTAGGGFAEVALAPASLAVPVPATVDSAVAAAAPLALSSAVLLLDEVVRIRPGESVVMHSAGGGLGSAVAQVAGALGSGLRIGVVGDAGKVAAAVEAGWEHVVVMADDAIPAIRKLVPDGADVVLDPSGTQHLELDLEIVASGARVVLFGNPAGGRPAPLPPMGRLIGGNVGILGFSISGLRRTRPELVATALRRSLGLLDTGAVKTPVTVVDGLGAVAEVHDLLAARRGTGKYVARVA